MWRSFVRDWAHWSRPERIIAVLVVAAGISGLAATALVSVVHAG